MLSWRVFWKFKKRYPQFVIVVRSEAGTIRQRVSTAWGIFDDKRHFVNNVWNTKTIKYNFKFSTASKTHNTSKKKSTRKRNTNRQVHGLEYENQQRVDDNWSYDLGYVENYRLTVDPLTTENLKISVSWHHCWNSDMPDNFLISLEIPFYLFSDRITC